MSELIPGQWVELFRGLDIASLVMLSVIAFALERAKRVTDAQQIVLLLIGGGTWGALQAFTTYGAGTPAQTVIGFIAKGVLMNAGGAYLIAQLVSVALKAWPGGRNGTPQVGP